MESSIMGGVQNGAQALFRWGRLGHGEEPSERMAREAIPGVGEVHSARMLRAIPL